jgi:hypothetical protein
MHADERRIESEKRTAKDAKNAKTGEQPPMNATSDSACLHI